MGRLQHFFFLKIPADAKIPVVVNGKPLTSRSVRSAYRRLAPIENLTIESRGWTLDVLNVVRSRNKTNFLLADVYAKADYLGQLHRNNSHVRDKIGQQLQVLRDMGILEFSGDGAYRPV
jgi:type II restriction enzyme